MSSSNQEPFAFHQITICTFTDSGHPSVTKTANVDAWLTVADILHTGNTGLTEDELHSYLILDPSGVEVSTQSKVRQYGVLCIHPRSEVYPAGKLRWPNGIIYLGEHLASRPSFMESIRRTLKSFGCSASYETIGEHSDLASSLLADESRESVLAVVYAPDLWHYEREHCLSTGRDAIIDLVGVNPAPDSLVIRPRNYAEVLYYGDYSFELSAQASEPELATEWQRGLLMKALCGEIPATGTPELEWLEELST